MFTHPERMKLRQQSLVHINLCKIDVKHKRKRNNERNFYSAVKIHLMHYVHEEVNAAITSYK